MSAPDYMAFLFLSLRSHVGARPRGGKSSMSLIVVIVSVEALSEAQTRPREREFYVVRRCAREYE